MERASIPPKQRQYVPCTQRGTLGAIQRRAFLDQKKSVAPSGPVQQYLKWEYFYASSTPASNDSSITSKRQGLPQSFATQPHSRCAVASLYAVLGTTTLRCWMNSWCTTVDEPRNAKRSRSMESANCVGRWCKSLLLPWRCGQSTTRRVLTRIRIHAELRLASVGRMSYCRTVVPYRVLTPTLRRRGHMNCRNLPPFEGIMTQASYFRPNAYFKQQQGETWRRTRSCSSLPQTVEPAKQQSRLL